MIATNALAEAMSIEANTTGYTISIVAIMLAFLSISIAFVLTYYYWPVFVTIAFGVIGVIALVVQVAVLSPNHVEKLSEAIESNIEENFNVEKASVEEGIQDFVGVGEGKIFKGKDETPVLKVKFYYEDSDNVSTHKMMYDETHNIMVPLQEEASVVTEHIREGSQLDKLLSKN